jgi:hypothetical protein
MQTAHIMLDIGGDAGNQIPKRNVTAAEMAVLIAIHGESAVHDIEPTGEIDRSNREELERLHRIYGRAKNGSDQAIVDVLFPGAAARVFQTIDELGVPEEFFKPTARAAAVPAKAADPLDHDSDGKKGGSKKGAESTRARGKAKAKVDASEPASEPAPEIADDGVEDMVDSPLPAETEPAAENLFG